MSPIAQPLQRACRHITACRTHRQTYVERHFNGLVVRPKLYYCGSALAQVLIHNCVHSLCSTCELLCRLQTLNTYLVVLNKRANGDNMHLVLQVVPA